MNPKNVHQVLFMTGSFYYAMTYQQVIVLYPSGNFCTHSAPECT